MELLIQKVIDEQFKGELTAASLSLVKIILEERFRDAIIEIGSKLQLLENELNSECDSLRHQMLKTFSKEEEEDIDNPSEFIEAEAKEAEEAESVTPNKFRLLDVLDNSTVEERIDPNFIIDFSTHYKERRVHYQQMNLLITEYLAVPLRNYNNKLEKDLNLKVGDRYYSPLTDWLNGCGPTKSFINNFRNGNLHSLLTEVQKTTLNNSRINIYGSNCETYKLNEYSSKWYAPYRMGKKMRGLKSPVTEYLVQIWWNNYGRLSFQNWKRRNNN